MLELLHSSIYNCSVNEALIPGIYKDFVVTHRQTDTHTHTHCLQQPFAYVLRLVIDHTQMSVCMHYDGPVYCSLPLLTISCACMLLCVLSLD